MTLEKLKVVRMCVFLCVDVDVKDYAVFTCKCIFFCVPVFTVYFVNLRNINITYCMFSGSPSLLPLIDYDVQTLRFHGDIMKNNHDSWMYRDFTCSLYTGGLQKKQELAQCC